MSKLILIPTPIGNLEDITLRSIRMLKEADFILAEDTRVTSVLLKHFQIDKKVMAHHKFNEHQAVEKIIDRLKEGATIAMVSDAGTPSISDPGFLLVRACVENEIEVECLPGPTALIPALVNSGLPSDRFCFEGFLPQKKGKQKKLAALAEEERTIIFYESPFRLLRTLNDMIVHFGGSRRVSVSRELSKIYEETVRGSLEEVATHFSEGTIKGEIVIVVEGKSSSKKE
jgi:16S rRNA (cytidine1402-2'-O)-methyltransferase